MTTSFRILLRPLSTLLLIGACESTDAATSASTDTAAGSDTATSNPATPTAAEQYACVDDDFEPLKPLSGDGFDPEKGLIGERRERYIVHTTQLVVPPAGMEAFGADMGDIFGAMAQADGLIAVSLAGSVKCGFNRTLGVWRDEAAMWAFVASPAHVKAMTNTMDYATAGRVEHWEATAEEVEALTWESAMARLNQVDNSPVFPKDDLVE